MLEECLQQAQHANHKRSKVRKVNHTYLPEGSHIEDLPPAMPIVSQLTLLTE